MALDDPEHHTALSARYGGQDRPDHILWNDTIATQLAHHSVRAYLPTALPEHMLETLVAAAQSAASSSNQHLWSVIAVTDQALRNRLAVLARNQRHIAEAPLILLWVADVARTRHLGQQKQAPTDGTHYLDSFLTAALDAALAAQNAAIAAESLGLGTVYIGALRNHPEEVAALVDLPEGAVVIFGLVVGYADPDRPTAVKPRPAQAIVVHRDTFSGLADAPSLEAYDAASRGFQKDQGQPETGWIAPAIARMADAKALGGRDRLHEALNKRGFGLL
jgi:nitroreductase